MTDFQAPSPPPESSSSHGRSRLWSLRPWVVVVSLLAIAFFFGSCGLAVGAASTYAHDSSATEGSSMVESLVDGEQDAGKKIAVINIQGVIMESMGAGPGSVSHVIRTLKALEKDEKVVGVLLVIDTPGGGVTASDRIYHELQSFKTRTKLPMHALFLDVAASGGYYVAMAADRITAHPTTVTGSIGVISKFYNVSGAMEKIGVSVNVVKSLNSQGKVSFKDIGSPYRPMSPEERALIQGLITEMWDRFTSVVIAGREGKMKPDKIRALADGRVFTGEQALAQGLVDAVGYREDAYRAIRDAAKAPEAKLVTFEKPAGLKEMLGFSGSMSSSPPSASAELARRFLSDQASFLYLWTAGSISSSL